MPSVEKNFGEIIFSSENEYATQITCSGCKILDWSVHYIDLHFHLVNYEIMAITLLLDLHN